jgi:glycerol-3-phosphate dehydrogenase
VAPTLPKGPSHSDAAFALVGGLSANRAVCDAAERMRATSRATCDAANRWGATGGGTRGGVSCGRAASVSAQSQGEEGEYELIVVGAGINGAAIAREAALAGLKVLIVERGDIGGGTSSASSRLIHGGLRYLEHAEIGLVYESLRERERLLELAPHLVEPLELCIPVYREARRKRWQIGIGLALYDLLSAGKSLPSRKLFGREELLAKMPGLNPDGLVGGASYYDAQVRYPERLVLDNVRDAIDHGAVLATYTRVTRIRVERGRATGVDWESRLRKGGARAPLIVNAAGPWVDEVLGPIRHTRLIGGTKGSHIVVPPFPGAPSVGVYVEAGSDHRPFFILPWNELLLIGTTDERYDADPGTAEIDARERAYLAGETQRVFPGATQLAGRVLYTHTGVRPLPHTPRGAEGAITRRHIIRRHRAARGLYSIVGGKLTTHRALAEEVLDKLRREARLRATPGATRARALPSALAAGERDSLYAELSGKLGERQARRLLRVYGKFAADVAALAARPGLDERLGDGGVLLAELVYALDREWAVTLEDLLQRRCMAGLDADFGLRTAAAAAAALARVGIWGAARAEHELARYRELAARHGACAP